MTQHREWTPAPLGLLPLRTDATETAAFIESLTAGYACRSWFCRDRGPFLTTSLEAAEQLAKEHRAQKVLGIWRHRVVVYRLDERQRRDARAFAEFMRRLVRAGTTAFDALRAARDDRDQKRPSA
ncbi:MAG TPA: hypothetical protein VNN10_00560 [Dehalococcoidia bacterium]|nr:hypothetical protein [Dehalococcoidia bacterium]